MNYYPDPEHLASAWRQLADTANENGETPLFPLGPDSLYRNSWLNLLALNRMHPSPAKTWGRSTRQ